MLLSEVANNKVLLSETLISQQGKLPRELLKFILRYQWINENELLQLCSRANDQKIRAFWLNHFIENTSDIEILEELKKSRFKDIQYQLFDVLYQKNILTTEDLILFWHSKFASIMDYAYFALRQQNFDFEAYFQEHPINQLVPIEATIRAKQWILLKGDLTTFFNLLKQINSASIRDSIIFLALRKHYLTVQNCLDYFSQIKEKLDFFHISKFKKNSEEYIGLAELHQYLSLIQSPISIKQRLSLVDDYNVWGQLYWFVTNQQYIQNDEDGAVFESHIAEHLPNLAYAIYGEQWFSSQKAEMQALLPAFVQSYPHIFVDERIQKLLNSYLE
jgi:hypothetical protein